MARPVRSVTPPGRPGRPGGLGEKVEATVERILAWTYDSVVDPVSDRIRNGIDAFLEAPRKALHDAVRPIISRLLAVEGVPAEYKQVLSKLTGTEPISLTIIAAGLAMGVIGGLITGLVQPISRVVAQWVDAGVESARAGPATAWPMTWRSPEHAAELMRHMQQMGWNETIIDAWMEVARPRLSPTDLLANERRFGVSQSVTTAELKRRGYTGDDIETVRRLAQLIPGPGDLISMAVREAWRDDIAERWGYDADFPPEFAEWMKKLGDEDGWARKYWRAHWDLPGLSTVQEILHRVDEFGLDDLDTFLRISDIPATWRDYIKRVAYVPLTRVDVRRMYAMGVLTREEVKRNYLDIGYDDLNAERMTEFTVRYETDTEREASKSDILSGLSFGMLTVPEATEWLRDIGYTPDVASFLVAREAAKVERKQVAAWVKHIGDLFTHREITLSEASSRLNGLGLASGEVQRYLEEWSIDLEARAKRPSRATLQAFFKQDVIDREEFQAGLRVLGYQEKYITWYLRDVLADKEEEARRAEEKARDEQEGVRKRKVKSDYQIAKSLLDVDVSEIRTAIAETQVALQERTLRYRRDLDIARKALTEVELKFQAGSDITGLQAGISDHGEAILFLAEQIETLQTEIAAIKLEASLEVATIGPERAKTLILERQFRIETIQDEMAAARVAVAGFKERVRARRAQLVKDLDIVARIRTVEEIDAAYALDQEQLTARLSELRVNLSELREQKATLEVGYREGLLS